MKETENSAEGSIAQSRLPAKLRKISIYAGIALLVFLLGFVPMRLSSSSFKYERDRAQVQLRLSMMQNTLGTAALDTRRGEFESARQQMSNFYTELRVEFENSSSDFKTPEQRQMLQRMLDERDETITLLARNDAASADRLTDLYFAFVQAKSSIVPEPAQNK